MATSTSPAPIETKRVHEHHEQHKSHLHPASSVTPRTLSFRAKNGNLPIPQPVSPTHNRVSSRISTVDDIVLQSNYVTSNTAQSPRRSSSRSHPNQQRPESSSKTATRQPSRPSRYVGHSETMVPTTDDKASAPVASATPVHESRNAVRSSKSRTTIPAASGNWVLGKTIGAGSMGKVKLARRVEGGEQVAVKIVPRGSADENRNQSKAERDRADHSKEVRTAREAAIVTLLDHPYICGLKDVVRTTNHWYMLFEYVNGGQMLDYIISHGRLKEKQARKFSRQIASALDYCHRNSIVHRDLKIENILISKTGDIKIIDFGLSNMFNPRDHLKTFCGSLYFAAPELLQAKQYTGPEVDVWSFGIVLYVLVCGKVPFDDQSMPALHAKIKKGVVEYPNWLTPECKNIISRMLVTDPRQRASLQEIMNHSWMLKGFVSPPENYLPAREILQTPLDPYVIHAMTGFDFGHPEIIHSQLNEIIESAEYIKAVRMYAQERETQGNSKDLEKKRGFGFDFYKRRSYSNSRDTLTVPSSEVILPLKCDPINAFHPLVSVYYLVREKQERDRPGVRFGTTRSPPVSDQASRSISGIPAPQSAHTNLATYEMPGENATGGRSRPRARTHGEDEITGIMGNIKVIGSTEANPHITPEPSSGHSRKGSTAAGILRRLSTRRRKDNLEKSYPPLVTVSNTNEPRKSLNINQSKDRDSYSHHSATSPDNTDKKSNQKVSLSPPRSPGNSIRSSRILARSSSVNSTDPRHKDYRSRKSDLKWRSFKDSPSTNDCHNFATPQDSAPHRHPPVARINQKMANRAKSLGHARRESIQARRSVREFSGKSSHEDFDGDTGDTSSPSNERIDHTDNVKPVFLKGLFSVSTTSTKPVAFIRADIIRVLKQHSVEFREIRGGFNCRHTPSIDLNKIYDIPTSNHTPTNRRRISFVGMMGGSTERDRDDIRDLEKSAQFRTHIKQNRGNSTMNSDTSDESIHGNDRGLSARAVGDTTTHIQSDLGGSMILEFEIFIIKVPLLSLHGLQFKRLAGGTWQYKNMADQILRELRL